MNWRYPLRQKSADYRFIFKSAEGQRVLLDLCRAHKVFDSTFNKDERIATLQEGERNAVLRILTIMKYTEKDILELTDQTVEIDDGSI